jgi:hypothetical protein
MNDTCIRCACEAAYGLETTAFYTVAKIQYVSRAKDVAVRRGAKNFIFLIT